MIQVITDKPIAYDSLDHINPYGCVNDNNSSCFYINEVKKYFNNNKINVLDLGCAGGRIIVDHILWGDLAVGLEGSDNALNGAGAHNWRQYKDKNLFFCDITEPFKIVDENGNLIKFDYIQMWEVLEHIPEDKLPVLFKNIKDHLKDYGLFAGSVATYHCESGTHVSVFPKDKWYTIMKDNGIIVNDYPFTCVPRGVAGGDHGFVFSAKKEIF